MQTSKSIRKKNSRSADLNRLNHDLRAKTLISDVRSGLIKNIKSQLTAEDLSKKSNGITLLHVLLERSELHEILDLLTIEMLVAQDWLSVPPFFWLSELVDKKRLPDIEHLLTAKNIAMPDSRGSALLHYLPFAGYLHKIKHLLTQEHLRLKDADGNTVVHIAAEKADLIAIRHLLTPDMLKERNNEGWTVPHIAAENGCLEDIKNMLSSEFLSQKNDTGWAVVHSAAAEGYLGFILDFHTPDVLLTETDDGSTAVHVAARCGMLCTLSGRNLPAKYFTKKNEKGETPVDAFIAFEMLKAEYDVERGERGGVLAGSHDCDNRTTHVKVQEKFIAAVRFMLELFPDETQSTILRKLESI